MAGLVATFIRSQLLTSIPYPTSDFSGQTVIVTGSNTGLGLEAARHIVRLNAAKVILAVRTLTKGDTAAESIAQSCNVPPTTIEVWKLDMSDHASIKSFANRASELERLDAAILNAGILTNDFKAIDGVESHIAVNVIGTLLLATLLLPMMQRSAQLTGTPGRLTIVGSDLMYFAPITEFRDSDKSILAALNDPESATMAGRYALSKLLAFYSLRELAKQSPLCPESNVILTDVTPGFCESDIFRDEQSWPSKVGIYMLRTLLARSSEVGGRTYVHAVDPALPAEAHGRFLMDAKIAANGANVDSPEGQELAKRWNKELFALLEEISPGCTRQ